MLALVIATLAYSACAVTVSTQYGAVKGKTVGGVHHFLGVPYAAPPVGNLRFAKTEPVKPWSGVLSAVKFAPGCPSTCPTDAFPIPRFMCTPVQSEDCLYLNIYTPDVNPHKPLPVILFIHGGDYMFGAGGVPLYDGTVLVQKQNVVVVTINYRLGILGALYTGTLKGNYQLLDQREAMKFTQSVISKFGGDPQRVTISGQSAGAFSVLAHMASPKSWPYFAGGMALSPPMGLPTATPYMAEQLSKEVLKKVGCLDATDHVTCLRSADVSLFVNATTGVLYPITEFKIFPMFMEWVPVVDGDEMPLSVLEALTTGRYNKVPLMVGTTANDSVQFIRLALPKPLSEAAYTFYADILFGVGDAIKLKSYYPSVTAEDRKDMRSYLARIITDYVFYCPLRYIGDHLRRTSNVYIHYFDYLASFNQFVFGKHMPYCVKEVCHAEDIPFYFFPFATAPAWFHPPKPTEADKELSAYMQTMWGNFARTGSPNPLPGAKFNEFYGAVINNVQNLSSPVTEMSQFRNDACDFWDKRGYNNAFN